MNKQETRAARKRLIRALLQECTPKERWQIYRNMVKRKLSRIPKNITMRICVMLSGSIENINRRVQRQAEKAKYEL